MLLLMMPRKQGNEGTEGVEHDDWLEEDAIAVLFVSLVQAAHIKGQHNQSID